MTKNKTRTYQSFVDEYKPVTANSESGFMKDELPYIKAFFPYAWFKTKEHSSRFVKHFKDEWSRTDSRFGIFHKPLVIAKYSVLLAAGIAACIPGYSSLVGFWGGMFTGIASANRNSFGVAKTIFSALYGAYVGATIGFLPVIGPGLACGITKGTIEGVQDGWNSSKDIAHSQGFIERAKTMFNNSWSITQTLGKRIGLGMVEGIIPVLGMALTNSTLDRRSAKELRSPATTTPGIGTAKTPTALDLRAIAAKAEMPKGVVQASNSEQRPVRQANTQNISIR